MILFAVNAGKVSRSPESSLGQTARQAARAGVATETGTAAASQLEKFGGTARIRRAIATAFIKRPQSITAVGMTEGTGAVTRRTLGLRLTGTRRNLCQVHRVRRRFPTA